MTVKTKIIVLYLLLEATWQWALQCRTAWGHHWLAPSEQPKKVSREQRHTTLNWWCLYYNTPVFTVRWSTFAVLTLMLSSRAVGFLMPSGTHFLWAGSSSSFPKRLQSPSSSKVVSTCLGVAPCLATCVASSLTSSLNSIFSVSTSLSPPLEEPLPV